MKTSVDNKHDEQQQSTMDVNTQDRHEDLLTRQVFIKNIPSGTTELLLIHFLNAAMRRVGLCQSQESPFLNCQLKSTHGCMELVNTSMADAAVKMTGVPFLSSVLEIQRPCQYEALDHHETWEQLRTMALLRDELSDEESDDVNNCETFSFDNLGSISPPYPTSPYIPTSPEYEPILADWEVNGEERPKWEIKMHLTPL